MPYIANFSIIRLREFYKMCKTSCVQYKLNTRTVIIIIINYKCWVGSTLSRGSSLLWSYFPIASCCFFGGIFSVVIVTKPSLHGILYFSILPFIPSIYNYSLSHSYFLSDNNLSPENDLNISFH